MNHSGFQYNKRQFRGYPPKSPRAQRFDFNFKFSFDHFSSKQSERAVFSWPQLPGISPSRVIGNLRDELVVRLGAEAGQSQPRSRLRTIEQCSGVFVVQVRAGVSDCAVRKLQLNMTKRELSIEWKDLFVHFFTEKSLTGRILKSAPVLSLDTV